jgi:hypothetical protein
LIPLYVKRATEWMKEDEENMLIIHCKVSGMRLMCARVGRKLILDLGARCRLGKDGLFNVF